MTYDHTQGRIYASEVLSAIGVSSMDKLVSGLGDTWKQNAAQNLVNAAVMRLAEGINTEYQRGVIERAREELE